MNRQEVLDSLDALNEQLASMTDEEPYAHMMATSPSFRATVAALDDFIASLDYSTDGDYSDLAGSTEASPLSVSVEGSYSSYGKMKKSVVSDNTKEGVKPWSLLVA